METVKVKPAREELKVRDPKTMELLPLDGAVVEMSTYWARRIRSGDVVVVEEQKSAAKVSKT